MSNSYLDPATFRPDAVDPATRAFNDFVEQQLKALPPINTVPIEATREARRAGRGATGPIIRLDTARNMSVPGPAGPITLRLFQPDTVRGVYYHIHGGGWTIGGADMQDQMLDAIAKAASVAVLSVEYRLAPEHPSPAAEDDCEAAALWLVQNARSEFGTDALVIGGESAGAHLSALTLLRLRDLHAFTDFRAAVLTYGCYDLGQTPSVRRWGERNLVLSGPIIDWFIDCYTCGCDPHDPSISPLYADLRGLPRALFTVGTLDPLLDDSLFMHARWVAAGNEAELAVYPGAIHGFNLFPAPLTALANARIQAFIADAVSAASKEERS